MAICARGAEALDRIAAEVHARGVRALPIAVNLREPDAAQAVVDRVLAEWGRVDILVNNAGASRFGDPLTLDDAAFQEALELKYLGYVRMSRAVAPAMIERRAGAIVNVAGSGGVEPMAVHLPGGAANAAIILFTKGFGRELARHGVRMNALSPTGVATERFTRLMQADAVREGTTVDEMFRRASADIPLARLAEPREVADAVLFLASERASYFAAAHLVMDGASLRGV